MRLLYQNHRDFRFSPNVKTLDFAPHLHSAVEIFFFSQGSSNVLYGNERFCLSAGDVFIAFPNQIHGYEESRDIRGALLIVPLKPFLGAYYSMLTGKFPQKPYLKRGEWEHSGLPALLALAQQDLQSSGEMLMQGYLHIIVGKLLSLLTLNDSPTESDDGLKKILLYLNAHYKEPVSRQQIAKAVGYNESYVSHVFSNALNITIPEYINSLRIYDATKLLEQTELSVTQISSEIGFGSIRNFNRVFLRHTGVSPKEYRSTLLNKQYAG